MAHAAPNTRIFADFRSRSHSPVDNTAYATATATSFRDVIHSTPQRYQAPHFGQEQEPSEFGSDGSADMSIEIGRGVKRSTGHLHDISPNVVMNLGNDSSQLEAFGTPVRPNSARKPESGLRREASIRRASEVGRPGQQVMKKGANRTKTRVVSDSNLRPEVDEDVSFNAQEFSHSTATITTRASRFVRQTVSGPSIPKRFTTDGGLDNFEQPRRQAVNGAATTQSGTFTANQSFALPDIANLTELVAGVQRNGLNGSDDLVQARSSRFTSGSYNPQGGEYLQIKGINLPDDERRILASLEQAKAKISGLEAEKTDALAQAVAYQEEIQRLRIALDSAKQKPNGNVVVDETTGLHGRGAMDRFERAERKISIMEIAKARLTKERDTIIQQRDHLVTEAATARYDKEQLQLENDALRDACSELEEENEDLSHKLVELKAEHEALHSKMNATTAPKAYERTRSWTKSREPTQNFDADIAAELTMGSSGTQKSRKHADSKAKISIPSSRLTSEQLVSDEEEHTDMTAEFAAIIEREVQKYRERAAALTSGTQRGQRSSNTGRDRSRARHTNNRRGSSGSANFTNTAAPAVPDASGTRSLPGQDNDPNRKSTISAHDSTDNDDVEKPQPQEENITLLSELNELDVADMRRKLEAELRAKHSATSKTADAPSLPRKSSLKDLTAPLEELSKQLKTVRVQSPHTNDDTTRSQQATDAGELSALSNISRRRQRRPSEEGMTSAFIIPDITMQPSAFPLNSSKSCIPHNASACTVCTVPRIDDDSHVSVSIPKPIPVSQRDNAADLTDVTLRPSQSPALALATVIKTLHDEITHLKLERETYSQRYTQHDPSLGKRKRIQLKQKLDSITVLIEKRSDQVYALYDVLEGQQNDDEGNVMTAQEIEESLLDVGLDPVELSGRVGRKGPAAEMGDRGLDEILENMLSGEESDELPWEGLSDAESEL